MPWAAAAAAAAGAIGGAALQADAAKSAAQTQANAAKDATNAQLSMFRTINDQSAPYRAAGNAGLSKLSSLLGINTPPGTFVQPGVADPTGHWSVPTGYDNTGGVNATGQLTKPNKLAPFFVSANPSSYQDFYNQALEEASNKGLGEGNTDYATKAAQDKFAAYQAANPQGAAGGTPGTGAPDSTATGSLLRPFTNLDTYIAPNYQFRLDQGLGATANFLNKTGGLVSGNTLRGINDYAQGVAGDAYGQAFDIYNAQQTNIFNRLASIAGIGQTANTTTAGAGTNISGGVANSLMQGGAASAAGQIGSANAIAGGLNNAGSWYAASKFFPQNSGGTTAGSAGAGIDA